MIKGHTNGGFVLSHGSLEIPFQVDFGQRQQLTIHVHPELRLEVKAPQGRELDRVLNRVNARARWISKQWRFFEKFQPLATTKRFVSGETVLYLGRQYRLKVLQKKESSAKLIGRFLNITHLEKNDFEGVQELVSKWYLDHASALFSRRLEMCLAQCKSLKLEKEPKLTTRLMKRRWGSCTKSGNISLNIELVKTPIHCIDYVIIHELCHIKVHNHSPSFYRLLSQCLPDWESRKSRLESFRLE